jgi:hypothetical protein
VFAGVDASRRDDATRFGAVLEGFWFGSKLFIVPLELVDFVPFLSEKTERATF